MLRTIIVLGILLLQGCQLDMASREERLKTEKKHREAAILNTQLGLGYLKQGDRPRAKKKLLTALKQDPDSPEVHTAMAYFFEQSGDRKNAGLYYKMAMARGRNGGAQLNNYGAFLCKQGQYEEADRYFIQAVNDSNYINIAAAYENAGICALKAKDIKKASHYFKNALEQDPSRINSYAELIRAKEKLGQHQEALDIILKYPLLANQSELLEQEAAIASAAGKQEIANAFLTKIKSEQTGVNNDDNSRNG